MPSRWRWTLRDQTQPQRRVLHATLSRWLDTDHHAKAKPWSWSMRPTSDGHVIDIGLVDDALAEPLMTGFEHYRRHGRGQASAASLAQIEAVTWERLARGAAARAWTVRFASPVTFRRGDRFLPWPAPSSVFGSLRATWRQFAAPVVGDVQLDLTLDPIVVTAVDGASVVEKVVLRDPPPGSGDPVAVTVGGFLGRVHYAVDGPVDPTTVDSLVRLAPFAGVGAYTTRGFGGVHPADGRH